MEAPATGLILDPRRIGLRKKSPTDAAFVGALTSIGTNSVLTHTSENVLPVGTTWTVNTTSGSPRETVTYSASSLR